MINKRQEFNQLKKFLIVKRGITEIESVTVHDLRAYLRAKKNDGLQPQSIVSMSKIISAFFNWCVVEEYLTESPMSKVEIPKVPRKVIRGLEPDEVVEMIDCFSYKNYIECRNKAVIAMLADTGLRAMEIRTLLSENVKETTILVNGKGNKERIVFISPTLKKILIKYERMKEKYLKDKIVKSDSYFLTYQHRELSHVTVWKIVKEAGERTGIKDVHPHMFRHFYSVQTLNSGNIDVYSLSRLLGHSDVSTTQRYLQSMTHAQLEDKAILASPLTNIGRTRK